MLGYVICTGAPSHGGSSGAIPTAEDVTLVLCGFNITAKMRQEQESETILGEGKAMQQLRAMGTGTAQVHGGGSVTHLAPEGGFEEVGT